MLLESGGIVESRVHGIEGANPLDITFLRNSAGLLCNSTKFAKIALTSADLSTRLTNWAATVLTSAPRVCSNIESNAFRRLLWLLDLFRAPDRLPLLETTPHGAQQKLAVRASVPPLEAP